MREVLGIEIDDDLLERWRAWYSPVRQPFRVDDLSPELTAQVPQREGTATAEWRDTFFLYGGTWTWLTEEELEALPSEARHALRSRRRAHQRPKPSPVWPSRLFREGDGPLLRWVEAGVAPSEHARVSAATWARARQILPGAEPLAGTFSSIGSGANCFATVIAAADGLARADEWVQTEDIEDWLAHAAVTLGDGWVLDKPSQSWSSPRLVWTVRRLVHSWRFPGTRLSRHVLTP